MRSTNLFFVAAVFFICFIGGNLSLGGFRGADGSRVEDVLEEMYCGSDDCYSLLDLPRNASKIDIKKAYHRLAMQLHPDRNPSPTATRQFRKLAKAQEVLLSPDSRRAYDYYLAHPNSIMALYYGLRAIYPSQTHPGFVFVLILFLVSLGQYINNKWRYSWKITVVEQTPQFKKSMETEVEARCGPKFKKMDKKALEAIREEVKAHLLDTVELNGETVGSSPPPFELSKVFAVQCILLPYTLLRLLGESIRWTWKYRLLKQPYTKADEEILTMWLLKIWKKDWNAMDEKERDELLERKLWIDGNLAQYQEEKQDEEREQRLSSTRYRQWKRLKRKNA